MSQLCVLHSSPSATQIPSSISAAILREWLLTGLRALIGVSALILTVWYWNDQRVPKCPVSGRVVFLDGIQVKTEIIELKSKTHTFFTCVDAD